MSNPNTGPRVAIVTGGSGGIGRAVAERLAADGMRVVVHFAGNQGRADETVAAITAAGGTATAIGGDVAVHTAGILHLAPLAELDLADFDRAAPSSTRRR